MMFKVLTVFLAACCSMGGLLMAGCDTHRKPEIAFESISYEFPNVFIVGSQIIKRFDFTNKGNAPLEIQDIQSNCGCVATTASSAPVPPGGTGGIQVEIHRDAGAFVDQVFVYTNDPDKPMIPLQVSGIIKPPITFPKHIQVGELQRGQNVIKTVALTNNLPHPVEITAHTVSDTSLAVRIPEGVISPGGSRAFQAEFSLRQVGFYRVTLTLTIKAPAVIPGTDSDTLELSIEFQGRVLGGIVALPANLFLGALSSNESVERTLKLKTDGTRSFSVLGITADNVEVFAEPASEKRLSHDLLFTVSAPGAPEGLIEGTITLETDHPDASTIEVPVKGVVK